MSCEVFSEKERRSVSAWKIKFLSRARAKIFFKNVDSDLHDLR